MLTRTKLILGIAGGAIIGFAYYFFIGCQSGSCAITSNPYISTAYGALIGLLFAWPAGKSGRSDDDRMNVELEEHENHDED